MKIVDIIILFFYQARAECELLMNKEDTSTEPANKEDTSTEPANKEDTSTEPDNKEDTSTEPANSIVTQKCTFRENAF